MTCQLCSLPGSSNIRSFNTRAVEALQLLGPADCDYSLPTSNCDPECNLDNIIGPPIRPTGDWTGSSILSCRNTTCRFDTPWIVGKNDSGGFWQGLRSCITYNGVEANKHRQFQDPWAIWEAEKPGHKGQCINKCVPRTDVPTLHYCLHSRAALIALHYARARQTL
jgi:hypothetical protein